MQPPLGVGENVWENECMQPLLEVGILGGMQWGECMETQRMRRIWDLIGVLWKKVLEGGKETLVVCRLGNPYGNCSQSMGRRFMI